MKRVMITVDWDFFVPEDVMLDWGHREAEFFLNPIWMSRTTAMDSVKTNGLEIEFWEKMNLPWIQKVYVSDSHMDALPLAKRLNIDLVINYDQHHDCWPMRDKRSVGCDNWLTAFLKNNNGSRAVWVRPPDGAFNDSDDMDPSTKHLVVKDYGEPLAGLYGINDEDTVFVHVCRSGCWTPPWLDQNFIDFVMSCDARSYKTLRPFPWDGMTLRWGKQEFADARRHNEQIKQLMGLCDAVIV